MSKRRCLIMSNIKYIGKDTKELEKNIHIRNGNHTACGKNLIIQKIGKQHMNL